MCSDAPDAPDLTPQIEASERIAENQLAHQKDIFEFNQQRWDEQADILRTASNLTNKIASEQWALGKADRQRYQETYVPMMDRYNQTAEGYDTAKRREQQGAMAMASQQHTYDAQRENATQQLASYGIDPSQIRSGAIDSDARNQLAARQAAARTMSDQRIEEKGLQLRQNAIAMGQGLPAQSLAGYGAASQNAYMGSNAMAGAQGAANQGFSVAGNFGGQALQGYNQSANIANMGYQNQLSQFNATQANSPLAAVTGLVGAAGGAYSTFAPAAEGGAVPFDTHAPAPPPQHNADSVDRHPTMLADDEYVIPADVMKWKGQEFFEKLTDKSRQDRQGGQGQAGSPGALPTGVV